MVQSLVGQAVIRVVGHVGRHADARDVSGRGRGRADACPGSVGVVRGAGCRGAVARWVYERWGSWGSWGRQGAAVWRAWGRWGRWVGGVGALPHPSYTHRATVPLQPPP